MTEEEIKTLQEENKDLKQDLKQVNESLTNLTTLVQGLQDPLNDPEPTSLATSVKQKLDEKNTIEEMQKNADKAYKAITELQTETKNIGHSTIYSDIIAEGVKNNIPYTQAISEYKKSILDEMLQDPEFKPFLPVKKEERIKEYLATTHANRINKIDSYFSDIYDITIDRYKREKEDLAKSKNMKSRAGADYENKFNGIRDNSNYWKQKQSMIINN